MKEAITHPLLHIRPIQLKEKMSIFCVAVYTILPTAMLLPIAILLRIIVETNYIVSLVIVVS